MILKMKSYYGNQKPYVYVCFNRADNVNDFLNELDLNDIALCLNNDFNKQEERRIDNAYGVLLFITKNLLKDNNFRKVVEYAIKGNKNILCVYLEDVELDSSLKMQLNSSQALFKKKYADNIELITAMKSSVIFNDMKITDGQKKAQRRRAITLIVIPIVVALILFVTVIRPLMSAAKQKQDEALAQFGLAGLSEEDLKNIKSIQIVGDIVFENANEINKVSTNYNEDSGLIEYNVEMIAGEFGLSRYDGESGSTRKGSIEDISILEKMPNLERLTIAGQNISDISVIGTLKNLKELVINDNPITSIEPLRNCINLDRIELRNTEVSDLSPLYEIKTLSGIWAGSCKNISNIDGIENSNINCLELDCYNIRNIDHLVNEQRKNATYSLSINNYNGSYAFLSEIKKFDWLFLNDNPNEYVQYLTNASANSFSVSYDDLYSLDVFKGILSKGINKLEISNANITNLNGINDAFKGFKTLILKNCNALNDINALADSKLYTLELHDCSELEDISVIASTDITTLTIKNCNNINNLDFLVDSKVYYLTISEELSSLLTDEIKEKIQQITIE